MTAPSQPPQSVDRCAAPDTSVNLKIFAVELSHWGAMVVGAACRSSTQVVTNTGRALDRTKRTLLKPMLPRNSRLGRPYSPLGVGGLTAVIGIGGLVFGHNGMVTSTVLSQSTETPNIQANAATTTAVIADDLLVDSATLETIIPAGRLRDSIITHKVEPGETLEGLAQHYNVTVDSLKYVNKLGENDVIKPDQELSILPVAGVMHEVADGESLQGIADKWKVPAQAIVDVNWLEEPFIVHAGQKLTIPNAEIPKPTPVKPPPSSSSGLALRPGNSGPVQGSGRFLFPTSGQVTQYFSYYHSAIDIGAHGAAPAIVAADAGRVTFAGWWAGGGGNSVWIDHGNGYVTQYAHMSRISVRAGQSVGRGQQVGVMGQTGLAFGIHLHFIVQQNGRPINPLSVL